MIQMVAIVRLFVWIMQWLVMERAVPILVFILILVFRQASPVFKPFHNDEQLLSSAATQELFIFLFHCHSNPFLIDLPPPTGGA